VLRTMSAKRNPKQNEPAPAAVASAPLWICIALILVVVGIFGRTAGYDFVGYGDPESVSDNPHAASGLSAAGLKWAFTSTGDGLWIPAARISHLLDVQIFGIQSGMHHLVNVLLHAMAAVLLFLFLARATKSKWASAFVALAFAAHPLNVESVAWIAQRRVVLCGFFAMAMLWSYGRFVEKRSAGRYGLTAAMFVCALLSDLAAAALPVILALVDYWPLKRWSGEAVREKLPFAALSVVMLAIAGVVAAQAAEPIGAGALVTNALASYFWVAVQWMAPVRLAVFYPLTPPVPVWEWICGLAAIGLVTAAVLRASGSRPYLAVGWFWYLAALAPAVAVERISGTARSDHFAYLPLIGLAIMLAWSAAEFADRYRSVVAACGAILCAAWVAMAWINVDAWQNSAALFQHAIESRSANAAAYSQLGMASLRGGNAQDALADLATAAKLRPGDAAIEQRLGEVLVAAGRVREGIAHLQAAVRIRPDSAQAHAALAAALLWAGKTGDAVAEDRAALKADPASTDARYGLGVALADASETQEAQPYLNAALADLTLRSKLRPDDAELHDRLGRVLAALGRHEDAIVEFSAAVRLHPNDSQAHFDLGRAFAQRERWSDAFGEIGTAVRLSPDNANVAFRFAQLLLTMNRPMEAMTSLEQARAIDPELAGLQQTYDNLHVRMFGK
jgi:tetratricopeptide (TPR) repeat protein